MQRVNALRIMFSRKNESGCRFRQPRCSMSSSNDKSSAVLLSEVDHVLSALAENGRHRKNESVTRSIKNA
jgi:hypothetical protein